MYTFVQTNKHTFILKKTSGKIVTNKMDKYIKFYSIFNNLIAMKIYRGNVIVKKSVYDFHKFKRPGLFQRGKPYFENPNHFVNLRPVVN